MTAEPDTTDAAAPASSAMLEGARAARTEPERSEAAVLSALGAAPDDRTVRMGAYKFYFYNSRLAEALPHAAWCIADGARALGIAEDWRSVGAADADFASLDPAPRFFLQSLVAWGYCSLRIGAVADGVEALAKVAALDPTDRFGARRLAAVVERGGRDDDE